ncbi:MAG: radical SAM protein, partial [bacterium]|nr:radical SAM protein [bacterium]
MCNNGCRKCLTEPVAGEASRWDSEVAGRQVVIRAREAALHRDLPALVRELRARRAAGLALPSNGRLLLYPALTRRLMNAGVSRFLVKLFNTAAAAHDAHTRVEGSFEQAVQGIRTARALDAEVQITFPLAASHDPHVIGFARSLTDRDPVEMPEPEVISHASEYRYDVVALRQGVDDGLFSRWYFPMAHIHTGPVCNMRCVYCNVRGGDDQRLYSAAHIETFIGDAAETLLPECTTVGQPTIDFIGGEPTLHPRLGELIRSARDHGFPQVSICSNGVLLKKRVGYLDALRDAGLTLVRDSFHDHRTHVANRLARVAGLGAHYPVPACFLLGQTDIHAHFYRILLADTLDSLPDYLRFLAGNNRTGRPVDLALGMPSMRG